MADDSIDSGDHSLFKTKLPLTAGLKQRREDKMSAKRSKLFEKIMKDHGIDAEERARQNRITYDIPSLMEIKPKTEAA